MYPRVHPVLDWQHKGIGVVVKSEILTIARTYIDAVAAKFSLKSAYIFGSYAQGTFSLDSDIDLALVVDETMLDFEKEVDIAKLRQDIDLRIEPHTFLHRDFNEENPMAYEIIRTGIRLV